MARFSTDDATTDDGSGNRLTDYMGSFFGGNSGTPPPAPPQNTAPTIQGPTLPDVGMAGEGGTLGDFSGAGGHDFRPRPPQQTNPIPTLSSGGQVGGGTPWNPGASAPSGAPPGYQWDPNMAMFQPSAGGGGGGSTNPLFSGMDPRLVSFFQQNNLTPTGRGSGNTDIAYWNDLLSKPGADWGYLQGRILGQGGGGGGQAGLSPGQGTGFADPAYQQLNDMVQQRLRQLQQPMSFPQLDQYMQMLQQQQAAAKQRAQTFADQLTGRISQLQQPLLTDANVVQQRALASNNLLGQRDAALANARQNAAVRGFAPTSGLLAGNNRSINEAYTNAQSNIDAQLQAAQIQGDEQRRNQATNLQGLVQQALQGGDLTGLQEQAQASDLENQIYNINQNRQREALSTAQLPVDLTNQGFSNALNASNSNQNPLGGMMSLLGPMLALSGQNQNLTGQNAQGWGNLIQLITQGLG